MNLPLNEIAGPEVSPLLRKAIERTMWDAMNFNLYNELPKHLREIIDDSEYPQQETMRYALLRNLYKVYGKGNFSEAQWDTARAQFYRMEEALNINSRRACERFAYCDERNKY
jgi:hypothetical protein